MDFAEKKAAGFFNPSRSSAFDVPPGARSPETHKHSGKEAVVLPPTLSAFKVKKICFMGNNLINPIPSTSKKEVDMKVDYFRGIGAGVALLVLLAGCDQQQPSAPGRSDVATPAGSSSKLFKGSGGKQLPITSNALDAINVKLQSEGKEYRIAYAEYITSGEGNEIGQTVYARDVGNKQLDADFVPFDPRRADWSGPVDGPNDNITYAIDQTGDAVPPSAVVNGLTAAQTTAAIQSAMSTWNSQQCSDLDITQNPDYGQDLGYLAYLYGLGGSLYIAADIMHDGFRQVDFEGGVIAATYTFIFVDDAGNPTDVDRNGKADVAFREIYYDPSWLWQIDADIDVETIALHESGHGLSQAHFGKVFITNANGKLHFSPRAVMNAVYGGVLHDLLGSDIGGHCSIWANWPIH
jgi:hypothetical protein